MERRDFLASARALRRSLAAIAAAAGLGACGSTMPPPERIAAPGAAIAAADEAGARNVPQASLHLHMAEETYERAKARIEEGETDGVAEALDRAAVDAELALALARLEMTRLQAKETTHPAKPFAPSKPFAPGPERRTP